MQDAVSGLVSPADLERLLAALEGSAAGPELGLFGPASVSWKINREAALFLAAGRAALLQLAHPWVAAGIAEHSRTLHDPIGRFHQTFRVMFAMVFGPTDFACATARHLYQRHSAVRGVLPETAGRFHRGYPIFRQRVKRFALGLRHSGRQRFTRLRTRASAALSIGGRAVLRGKFQDRRVVRYTRRRTAAKLDRLSPVL